MVFGRYLHLVDKNPERIGKIGKNLARKLDFKDIKFPVKIRDIRKIEKKIVNSISVFGYGNREKFPFYV